jgi:uncharacterized protein (TIGR02246 family)
MQKFVCLLICLVSTSAFSNDSPEALQDAFMAALSANDADGLAACYTADATNFAVDSMVGIGPDAVRESWGGFFASFKVLEASLSNEHMETSGDLAAAWGQFHLLVEPVEGGESVEMHGRYMDVAKNIDGSWLYIADHASMPLPPPPED